MFLPSYSDRQALGGGDSGTRNLHNYRNRDVMSTRGQGSYPRILELSVDLEGLTTTMKKWYGDSLLANGDLG